MFNSPLSDITTLRRGIPLLDPMDSMVFTTSIPSMTRPNATCFPSNHGVFTYNSFPQLIRTVVMKNCDPLVSGPAFAMDSMPGRLCFNSKFSSGKRSP